MARQIVRPGGISMNEFIQLYHEIGPFELVDGEVILKPPQIAGHGEAMHIVHDAIHEHAAADGLGKALIEQAFVVSFTTNWVPGSRIPDVMYYTAERLEAYKAANPDWKLKPYVLVPDLVIEVISPTDDANDVSDKIDRYLLDGVRAVWAVDLARETVSIYTLVAHEPFTRQQTILRVGETLHGGEIIPAFAIPVAQIFA
ncbi:MAG: Uma2 family endonuclease [Anaerolineae bacterium]|nr:Uma2 family endonuclease [Anaerolineae bacterium]